MSDCILWTGPKAGKGYGVQSVKGKLQYVHRLVAAEAFGPIPPGMVVAHKCDVPNCINPDHLFVCTQLENLADMKRKGRSAKGDKHKSKTHPELVLRGSRVGTSKLKAIDVLAIRAAYKKSPAGSPSNTSLTYLADRYGVTFQTIHKIVRRQRWTHL